jgi:hypothetical protein
MCPPLVLGPVVHYLNSLDALNTSSKANFLTRKLYYLCELRSGELFLEPNKRIPQPVGVLLLK